MARSPVLALSSAIAVAKEWASVNGAVRGERGNVDFHARSRSGRDPYAVSQKRHVVRLRERRRSQV
ncbi:hypothetical protein SAMN02745121_05327 [Nannocystis exedens]|uniref:Uncharacterized protein n=1 Tax=Nannocystis exedens TaxID=54 RepID=A0A1I2CZF7_9BACT|nr:hypothetical protein NAEX_01669 [Nannocystis exedens]SFE73110.1 hypothetical protein SAMN02745121_05327 [Nannocystis exedens]